MLAPYFFYKTRVQISSMDFCTLSFLPAEPLGNAGAAIKLFEGVGSPLRFEALKGAVNGFYKGLLNLVHLQCP